MKSLSHPRALALVTIGVCLAGAVLCGAGTPGRDAKDPAKDVATAQPAVSIPDPPLVRDTPANLQAVFGNEVNAKARYLAYALKADQEGHAAAARVFRACARAEEVHADRHVTAIAWVGDEAMAKLGPIKVGTTAENLQAAIGIENYEATQLYPAFIARARAEGHPMAVRSMTFALSAEREHQRLLEKALATLEQRPTAVALHVCPTCGKTVESVSFDKCPSCFTGASRFLSI